MTNGGYEVKWVNPEELVTWNRLDIGMRTLYLDLKDTLPELADRIYYEDLRAQTLGKLIDPDNARKADFDVFKKIFGDISSDMKINGFDAEKTVLPIAVTGSILNGGHRLSSALVNNERVACVQTKLTEITCDYQYFFDRAVPESIIERSVLQLLKYLENGYIGFLWPSGEKNLSHTESVFENVVYKKRICLTERGALNLIFQCYHHMDWIGTERTGYRGLYQKLFECFPDDRTVTMIIFEEKRGLDRVRELKKRIRDINGIGYSSIHITDTSEELHRLSNLLCNYNGLHYLNNAKLIKSCQLQAISEIIERAKNSEIATDCFAIDGSWLLELYGLRNADDIDIVASSEIQDAYAKLGYGTRIKELEYHSKTADELILDSKNHFYLFGIKFISFDQIAIMKKERAEAKDLLDVELMAALIENRQWPGVKTRLLQRLLYTRILVRRRLDKFVGGLLRSIGLYRPVRAAYLRIKRVFS